MWHQQLEVKQRKLKIESERQIELDEKKRAVTELRSYTEAIKGKAQNKILKKNLEEGKGLVLMGGNKSIGIIMDEVDGMSSGDKGGVSELISFINPNKGKRKRFHQKIKYINPIICICNNDTDKKKLRNLGTSTLNVSGRDLAAF
jgi:hypothetical protein